jgi:hypothetical protein
VENGSEWLDGDGLWWIGCGRVLAACSYDLETALRLAREEAPRFKVNGMTAAQLVAWLEAREADRGC